jgi:hypothetical protein
LTQFDVGMNGGKMDFQFRFDVFELKFIVNKLFYSTRIFVLYSLKNLKRHIFSKILVLLEDKKQTDIKIPKF